MPKGVYAAASAMLVETRALEAAARNLAHLQTPGYRQEVALRRSFDQLLRAQGRDDSTRDTIQRDRGAGVAEHDRYFVHSDGLRDPTGNPFDLALSGAGFFLVRDGQGQELLTRAGHFVPDAQGRLTSPEGFQLQGQGGPIAIPPEAERILIARDGTVSAISTVAGQTVQAVIDQVRLVEVAEPSRLAARNGQYFDPAGQALADAGATVLHQGMLERANVSGVQQLVEMIALQRRHDAAQKSLTTQTDLGGGLGEILRT